MRTIVPCTRFACRCTVSCLCVLLALVPCLCNDVLPVAGATHQVGTSGRAPTHALHVPIIACKFYPRAWSLRAAGLALDRSTFLVGCVLILSLTIHFAVPGCLPVEWPKISRPCG